MIHAPLADRAVPCVYALMQRKCQDSYEELLSVVDRKCAALGHQPDPTVIITDFEVAAMQAVRAVFGESVVTRGCFFHLTQSTWRKIQELGMAAQYRHDAEFRHFCGMLDGLAFVPLDDVKAAMDYLRTVMPPSAAALVDYFDDNYVNGSVRSLTSGERRVPPRFAPTTWNLHVATLSGGDRTNNHSEGWNNHLQHLVGHKKPSVWRLIEALQADTAEASSKILRHAVGTLSPKRTTKASKATQERLLRLCKEYSDGGRDLKDFVRAVGHNIRLSCD